jgi:hypothetical protein
MRNYFNILGLGPIKKESYFSWFQEKKHLIEKNKRRNDNCLFMAHNFTSNVYFVPEIRKEIMKFSKKCVIKIIVN